MGTLQIHSGRLPHTAHGTRQGLLGRTAHVLIYSVMGSLCLVTHPSHFPTSQTPSPLHLPIWICEFHFVCSFFFFLIPGIRGTIQFLFDLVYLASYINCWIHGMKLFMTFPYYPFNVLGWCSLSSSQWKFVFFFSFVLTSSLARGLSILLILKNQVLVLLVFFILSLFTISLISALIFVISFLLLLFFFSCLLWVHLLFFFFFLVHWGGSWGSWSETFLL